MNWQEILTLLVPILGFMGWVYNRLDKKFESLDKKMEKGFELIHGDLKEIRKDIQSLDSRVSRIEGHLTGMHHWEPKIVEKKEEK